MKTDYIKFFSKAVLLAAQLNVASMAINAQAASQFVRPQQKGVLWPDVRLESCHVDARIRFARRSG